MSWSFNLYFFTPELLLVTQTLTLLVFGVWVSASPGLPIVTRTFFWLTSQVLLGSFLLVCVQTTVSSLLWNSLFSSNFFSVNAKLLLYLLSFGSLLISQSYLVKQKLHFFEFWILFILAIISISAILQATDLLTIYISIELQSLIFYIFASLNRNSEFSTEAGLKYFILGAFASAFLLVGSVLVYHTTGLTNLNALAKLLSGITLDNSVILTVTILGVFFILTAFLFKLNVAPFHFWSPDVYDGAPLAATAIFSFLPKIALTSLILKLVLITFFDVFSITQIFLLFTCLISAVVGFFGAFSQIKWKRFIAYSSIGHASFLVLGLSSNDLQSIDNILVFLIIYSVSSLFLFLILVNLQFYQFPNTYQIRFISQIKSLSISNSALAFFLLIVMFSFAGIPPLAGFFSKLLIILTALKTSLVGITIILITLNCFASFYYIRFTKLIYFDESRIKLIFLPVEKQTSITLSILGLLLVGFFLEFDYFLSLTKLMTLSLVN